jgi:hypothetical protein
MECSLKRKINKVPGSVEVQFWYAELLQDAGKDTRRAERGKGKRLKAFARSGVNPGNAMIFELQFNNQGAYVITSCKFLKLRFADPTADFVA